MELGKQVDDAHMSLINVGKQVKAGIVAKQFYQKLVSATKKLEGSREKLIGGIVHVQTSTTEQFMANKSFTKLLSDCRTHSETFKKELSENLAKLA